MKTYDEYYKISEQCCGNSLAKSEAMYGKGWWKRHDKNLTTSQDYDFTKSMVDKNDAPIIRNVTNVYNSEWCILHQMLIEMVVDYMKENIINDDVCSYSININLDKPEKKWTIYLKRSDCESIVLPESEPFDFPSFEFISDESVIKKFDGLNALVYKYVKKFLKKHSKDIPEFTNNVNFSIDNIDCALKYEMASTDSGLSIGWDKNGDENADELLVVSM
jgi:hypothetical protein